MEYPDQLYNLHMRIKHYTSMLRNLGLLASVATAGNLLCLIYLKIAFSRDIQQSILIINISVIQLTLCLIAIVIVITHEAYCRRGDIIFEELSNDAQWRFLNEADNLDRYADLRRKNRLLLSYFASASFLPLIPGKYGPGVYAAANIVTLLFSTWYF